MNFRLKGWRKAKIVLNEIISREKKKTGYLNIVISRDEEIRKINVQFLEHDYNTDVISFDYSEGNIVNGEIYISIDTVRRNSLNYNVSLNNEVIRVMIHGTLHLIGYDDKYINQKVEMQRMEDYWLKLFKEE